MNINSFISGLPKEESKIIVYLNELISRYPGVNSKLRYKVPFYFKKTWFCYLNPLVKKGGVEIVFVRGNEMPYLKEVLDFKDRKQVAGITVSSFEELLKKEEQIRMVIQEAILLDDAVKYKVNKNEM